MSVNRCINAAYQDLRAHGAVTRAGSQVLVGTYARNYFSGNTYLYISPGEKMTWGMYYSLMSIVREFLRLRESDPVQMSFILYWEGIEGEVGRGGIYI